MVAKGSALGWAELCGQLTRPRFARGAPAGRETGGRLERKLQTGATGRRAQGWRRGTRRRLSLSTGALSTTPSRTSGATPPRPTGKGPATSPSASSSWRATAAEASAADTPFGARCGPTDPPRQLGCLRATTTWSHNRSSWLDLERAASRNWWPT